MGWILADYFAVSGSFSPGRSSVGAFFLGGVSLFVLGLLFLYFGRRHGGEALLFLLGLFRSHRSRAPGESAWFSSRLS